MKANTEERREPSVLSHFLVYLTLMALLASTWAAARADLGRWNAAIGFAIAALKAALVGAFFMELNRSKPILRFTSIVGISWLMILLALSLSDYASRGWLAMPGHWPAGR